jgi:hypothetical protein
MSWTRTEETKQHPPDKPFCRTYPLPTTSLNAKMRLYLEHRGLDVATAVSNGWYPTKAIDGWGRVFIPCLSDQDENMYWQARLLEPPCRPTSPVEQTLAAKSGLSMPRRWESPHGVSRGNAVGVVWPPARTVTSSALPRGVVVEGPMDALACAELGYVSVALLSATPSEECLALTSRLLCGIMTLVIMDCGAEEPMIFNAGWLRERGVHCRLVNPYPYKDIAAFPKDERRRFLHQQLPL